MNSPVKVQLYEPCVRKMVRLASLDPPIKKIVRNRPRKSKKRRNQPKDILAAKWRANIDMRLLSVFPALEYRDHNYFGDSPSKSTIFEALRLMQNIIALGEKAPDNDKAFLNVVKNDENEPIRRRRISIMDPLRKKYKPSKRSAASQFLINFQRNTQEFQESLIRFKEFSETNITAKQNSLYHKKVK